MAQVQAVMPLVYRYVTAALGDALPTDAAIGLRRAFFGNAVRNLHLARELTRLTALLEHGGVEPLALKGPVLALAAYGAINLRQFTDLDFLVREGEIGPTVEMLLKDGYAPRAGFSLVDLSRPGAYEIAMVKPGTLTEIDLHWRLVPAYFPLVPTGEDLWRRAARVEIEGTAVRTLAPGDHLHYLCARAERVGARRVLALGVLLAHELFDTEVPASVLEADCREPPVIRAARSFISYVTNPIGDGPGFYQRWSVPIRVIVGPGARLRYLAARALLPNADDRALLRLPMALQPLHYLLRPVRVALKEGPAAFRRR
jgi:hypothetical protein